MRALSRSASPPEHLIGRRLVPITLCNYVATAHAAQLDPERGARPARWLAWAASIMIAIETWRGEGSCS
ncbi:hypothetical protein [Sorangium sp. So ce854]|uniref:Uncharacterized protein n=1 Tax=Sorangium cellulosum TaxID=56 RepID=A0A150PPK1_SORCE|nr:hypothetical protein BE08_27285 [Sorangium cellulosum]